jgi:hypothetical protein
MQVLFIARDHAIARYHMGARRGSTLARFKRSAKFDCETGQNRPPPGRPVISAGRI